MPTTVNASVSRQASQEEITSAPRKGRGLGIPDTFARDMRQHGVIPRPLRDPQGQLLQMEGTPNHALKHALETYQKAPPEHAGTQDADDHGEFYDVTCPVLLEPTTHPVQMGDGHTYDRSVAEQLAASGTFESPITRQKFEHDAAKPKVSASVQDLALYGHLVRHGNWRADAATTREKPLPALPSQRRVYVRGTALGLVATALGTGISTGVAFMMRNAPPTLQLPVCGLGDCGNVATQSFGTVPQTHTVAITGTDVTWNLLNAVNASGQAAVDACRVAVQVCWDSHVPLVQAFEKSADNREQTAAILPYIGAAAGIGGATLATAVLWYRTRRATRQARQAHSEAKREAKNLKKDHAALQARVEKMLRDDLEELRRKQGQPPARGTEIELMPLAREEAPAAVDQGLTLSSEAPSSEASTSETSGFEASKASASGVPSGPGSEASEADGFDTPRSETSRASASAPSGVSSSYAAEVAGMSQTQADIAGPSQPQAEDVAGPSQPATGETSDSKASLASAKIGEDAHRRLLKDLKELTRNAAHYPGITAGPVGDDLSVWEAKIALVDGPLAETGKKHGISDITLRIQMPANYPLAPPMVLVKEPQIRHDYSGHGALCADLLTPQHWQPTYSIGKLLVQLGEFLHATEANPEVTGPGQYNLKSAERLFNSAVAKPHNFGWKH